MIEGAYIIINKTENLQQGGVVQSFPEHYSVTSHQGSLVNISFQVRIMNCFRALPHPPCYDDRQDGADPRYHTSLVDVYIVIVC